MRKTKLDKELEDIGCFRLKSATIDKTWCLYDSKTKAFLAKFTVDRVGKIWFNGVAHKNASDLLEAVSKYNSSLYFPSDTYNPDYSKEAVDEMRLHDTMIESGLKMSTNGIYGKPGTYELVDDMGAKFATVRSGVAENRSFADLVLSENSWIPLKEDNTPLDEDSCKAIKSYLAATYVYHISVLVNAMSEMGELSRLDDIKVKTLDPKRLTVETSSAKDTIVRMLEDTLSRLK
jgi:hypothetical protein